MWQPETEEEYRGEEERQAAYHDRQHAWDQQHAWGAQQQHQQQAWEAFNTFQHNPNWAAELAMGYPPTPPVEAFMKPPIYLPDGSIYIPGQEDAAA